MSSDLRDLHKWDQLCSYCQGRRMDGMGNPPCPECGGISKRVVHPEDYDGKRGTEPAKWTDEAAADLVAFHGAGESS